MNERKRASSSYSSAEKVRVTIPLPDYGQCLEADFPNYGLKLLIERIPQESEEQVRNRFVVTAPVDSDHRTHAARLGTGLLKPKKMGVTLCTENNADPRQTGTRITGLGLDSVTCTACRSRLTREGVLLEVEKGNGS